MDNKDTILHLESLLEKLNDHWHDCIWIDASELMALGNALELLQDKS